MVQVLSAAGLGPNFIKVFRLLSQLIHKIDMSRKYKIQDQDKLYFVTFTVIHWLDVFIRRAYKDIFLDSLRFCQKNKGLNLCAYCIMSSHVHLIIGRTGGQPIEGILRDLKKFTSVKIIEAIKENPLESRKELFLWIFERAGKNNPNNVRYQFWQQHSHPLEINSNKALR
jgi:REP element-mobilizing transposase RayT